MISDQERDGFFTKRGKKKKILEEKKEGCLQKSKN
tara:strand:+ start:3245 stop:3349 length:105 start_codon:yes stop_codon:yes gene_type:complete